LLFDPAQPHFAFRLNLQGVIKLVRSDIPLFSEQITDSDLAGA
jgi:hypothetical protein